MLRRIVLAALALLLPVAAAAAVNALAPDPRWPDCTVTLLDGTVYEDVGVDWKLEGFLIRLTTADSREFDLNPRQVATIHDAQGRHITQEVADASPSDAEFAVLGHHKDEPMDLGLSLDVGGMGGLSGGYAGGVWSGGWFAGVRWQIADRWHLRVQYTNYYLRENVPHRSAPFETWTSEGALLVGYRVVHPRRNSNYTYLELGPVLVDWEEQFDQESGFVVPGGDPGWGGLLRGGVMLPLSSTFLVDVGAEFSLRPTVVKGSNDTGWVAGVHVALGFY